VTRALRSLGGDPQTRKTASGDAYRTDNGNVIVDTRFAPMDDPRALDASVRAVPGVVDTGLFLGMADVVLIGTPDGVERLVARR
jgi:ribose 5-phosphate isomerase A